MVVIERIAPNGDFYRIWATDNPYFSVTCEMWEKRGGVSGKARANAGHDPDAGGCLHEEILALVPELEPVVRIHFAWPDGTPPYARANGWYFYSREPSDHERAARALNISPDMLPKGLDENGFNAFVDSLAQTWSQQAQAARDVIAAFEH